MTSFLLQFVISNLLLSVPLALIAYAVHRSQRSPTLAHLLWVLVLAKLVTPPIFSVPVVSFPNISAQTAPPRIQGTEDFFDIETDLTIFGSHVFVEARPAAQLTIPSGSLIAFFRTSVLALWIAGGLFVLFRSLKSVFRFNRRLRIACRQADPVVQRLATEAAEQLGLRSSPEIYSVPAEITPLVWWIGGRAKVVIPGEIEQHLQPHEIKWILAHELAHIKRCDHLVRWLEWLACVVFWFNPIAWWARRCLRANEELCCDAMVLNALHPDPQRYGLLLLHIVELLTSSGIRPPAEACAIDSGGSLERRFRMIVSMNTIAKLPRWLSGSVLALAMGLLPFGIAYGQDYDAVERRLGAAVADGEITLFQAQTMMRALRATSEDRELEQLSAGLKNRLRHHEEKLHKQLAAGEITKEEMEAKFKAKEREMWEHYRKAEMKRHDRQREHDGDRELEPLKAKAGIKDRLRHHEEKLRRQLAAGEITQEEMEAKFKAKEREMWGHYREAEMKRHRRQREHGGDRELEQLKAGIEDRLRHHKEDLRKQLAAEEITQEEMEAKFKAKEREMWGHYRKAEMKRHRGDGE